MSEQQLRDAGRLDGHDRYDAAMMHADIEREERKLNNAYFGPTDDEKLAYLEKMSGAQIRKALMAFAGNAVVSEKYYTCGPKNGVHLAIEALCPESMIMLINRGAGVKQA